MYLSNKYIYVVFFLLCDSPASELYVPKRRHIQFRSRQGNRPKEGIQHSQHGESLKSSISVYVFFCCIKWGDFLAPVILVLEGCKGASGSCQPVGNKLNVSGVLDAVKGVIAVNERNHVCLFRQCSAPSSIKLRL